MEAEREQRLRMLWSDLAYASRKAGIWTATFLSKLLAGYSLGLLSGAWLFDDNAWDGLLDFGPMWVVALDELVIAAGWLCAIVWAILLLARMTVFLLERPMRPLVRRFNAWFDSYYAK